MASPGQWVLAEASWGWRGRLPGGEGAWWWKDQYTGLEGPQELRVPGGHQHPDPWLPQCLGRCWIGRDRKVGRPQFVEAGLV